MQRLGVSVFPCNCPSFKSGKSYEQRKVLVYKLQGNIVVKV